MSGLLAVLSLLLIAASLLAAPVGPIFAPFAFGLFLLALVGVLGGLKDRTVRQYSPPMYPGRWRDGS